MRLLKIINDRNLYSTSEFAIKKGDILVLLIFYSLKGFSETSGEMNYSAMLDYF